MVHWIDIFKLYDAIYSCLFNDLGQDVDELSKSILIKVLKADVHHY